MAQSVTSCEVRLKARPQGMPRDGDFELASRPLPPPGEGEILVRNLWMSVDPYMRGLMNAPTSYSKAFALGEPLHGRAIGRVELSRDPAFKPGDVVFHMLGWRDYATVPAREAAPIDPTIAPIEAFLGALGFPGLTAYAGLVRIAALRRGESVFVSAASGAVGSVAVQLAKARDCFVVASAGADSKCRWLKDVARADVALNYRTCGDLGAALRAARPDGIDVYFDNVGGAHLEAALDNMRLHGRVALCGMISRYNEAAPETGPRNLMRAIGQEVTLRGFVVRSHVDLQPAFLEEARRLVAEGRLHWRQSVEEGLENAPRAFRRLFEGGNFGKMLVRIAEA